MSDETALARRTAGSPARQSPSMALELSVDDALARFREEIGVPILTDAQAKLPPSGVAYAEVTEDGFVLRHPGHVRRGRGNAQEMGPCVEGRLVPTPDGARLELHSRTMAPTSSQRAVLITTAAIVALAGVAMIQAGTGGLLLIALLGLAVTYGRGYRERRRRELDLLARVQRVFGPVTRAAIEAPYRE